MSNSYLIIESGKSFDKNVRAFVAEFVSASSEKEQSLVQIKVKVAVEMASNELVDLLLGFGMKVLKFVQVSRDVQTVGSDDIRLPFDQMFSLLTSNFRDGRKNVRKVGSSSFNAVPVIKTSFASLLIAIEIGQVVVEISSAWNNIFCESTTQCLKREGVFCTMYLRITSCPKVWHVW